MDPTGGLFGISWMYSPYSVVACVSLICMALIAQLLRSFKTHDLREFRLHGIIAGNAVNRGHGPRIHGPLTNRMACHLLTRVTCGAECQWRITQEFFLIGCMRVMTRRALPCKDLWMTAQPLPDLSEPLSHPLVAGDAQVLVPSSHQVFSLRTVGIVAEDALPLT